MPSDCMSDGYHSDNKHAQYDARGIFLTYTCDRCHDEKMSKYRPDVLSDSDYWTDEEIYGDDE